MSDRYKNWEKGSLPPLDKYLDIGAVSIERVLFSEYFRLGGWRTPRDVVVGYYHLALQRATLDIGKVTINGDWFKI